MDNSAHVMPEGGREVAPSKWETLFEMFAAAPFLFVFLFLFLLVLAIPVKILNPGAKIFR